MEPTGAKAHSWALNEEMLRQTLTLVVNSTGWPMTGMVGGCLWPWQRWKALMMTRKSILITMSRKSTQKNRSCEKTNMAEKCVKWRLSGCMKSFLSSYIESIDLSSWFTNHFSRFHQSVWLARLLVSQIAWKF